MDLFGIGQAVKACAEIYFRTARGTGRTVSMLDSLKDGDRIIFADSREAERVRRFIRERELDVECFVVPPAHPEKIFDRGSSQGRTIFDHGWVEKRYLLVLEREAADLDYLERETSGFGEAHLETRRCAMEMNKWLI